MVISSLVNRFLGVVLALVVLLFFGSWARAQGAAATKPEPTNLTPFIPADVCAALVLHPSRMIESPLWQLLAGQAFPLGIGVPPGVALERARPDFDPRKILRVTILSSSPPEPRAVAAAIAPSVARSRTTTNVQGWLLEPLPVQRATSRIAVSDSSGTGSGRK